MNEFRDFTSLPPEEEAQFIVYEQRTRYWSKKALNIGMIVAGIFGLLLIIIVLSHDAPENLMADDDIGMLGDKEDLDKQRENMKGTETTPAPAPETTPAPEAAPEATPDPASATPAEAGEGEAAAPSEEPAAP
jgi:hypothetical protein